MREWFDVVDFAAEGIHHLPEPVPTGISALDFVTNGGLRPGLHVLGAPPGAGKTSFALHLVLNQLRAERKAAYVGLEIPSSEAFLRIASDHGCMDLGTQFSWSEAYRLAKAGEAACIAGIRGAIFTTQGRLLLDDFEHVRTLGEVLAAINDAADEGARLAVVDYMQIIDVGGDMREHERMALVTSALKQAGESNAMAVLGISSLNREALRGTADMHSTSGGSAIEYAAVTVMGIRQDPEQPHDPSNTGVRNMRLDVFKDRYGRVAAGDDAVRIQWSPQFSWWGNN